MQRLRLVSTLAQHPLHHKHSAQRGKSRSTMPHESLLSVRSRQPQTMKEALLMSTTLVGTTPSRADPRYLRAQGENEDPALLAEWQFG
jgi:hypothetical protein